MNDLTTKNTLKIIILVVVWNTSIVKDTNEI